MYFFGKKIQNKYITKMQKRKFLGYWKRYGKLWKSQMEKRNDYVDNSKLTKECILLY